jgi:hypothetical protein
VAVFISHSDESEVKNTSEFFVGGYIAPKDDWPYIARAWQEQVLDGPPRTGSLPYLHMSEMSEEWLKKIGMSYIEAQNRIDQAARILSCCGSLRVTTSAISQDEIKNLIHSRFQKKRHIPDRLKFPDYYCYLTYMVRVVAAVRRHFPDADKVDFVVSKKQYISKTLDKTQDDFREWFGSLYPDAYRYIGDVIPGDMETRLPLQAADVLCWHRQRKLSGKADTVDLKRLRLLYGRAAKPDEHKWTTKQLAGIVDNMFARLDEAKGGG